MRKPPAVPCNVSCFAARHAICARWKAASAVPLPLALYAAAAGVGCAGRGALLLTLPVGLVSSMGLLVVPVTAFVTWSLFGIQEIGLFIEHCALDDGAIFMDTITELVALDVMEAVEDDDDNDDDDLAALFGEESFEMVATRHDPHEGAMEGVAVPAPSNAVVATDGAMMPVGRAGGMFHP